MNFDIEGPNFELLDDWHLLTPCWNMRKFRILTSDFRMVVFENCYFRFVTVQSEFPLQPQSKIVLKYSYYNQKSNIFQY